MCCRLWGSPKSQLKVFNLDGSSFKVEKANFDERKRRREVWFYGTREKSYCLFVMGNDGTPITLKTSARTIGQYRSPYPIDRERRWIGEAWQYAICEVLAQPMDTPTWFELPATSQLTLTTRKLMDHYQKTCDPFDFLEVAQLAYPGLLRCCGDGAEPAPGSMRGLTIPRPVHVTSIEHMGKEVIVDPTDTPEELTAEQLSATDPVIYRDTRKTYDLLRAQIRAAGISHVAREAEVSRSVVKTFVNQGMTHIRPRLRSSKRRWSGLKRSSEQRLTRSKRRSAAFRELVRS